MNILLITNKLPFPPRDGGAIATLNLAKGFAFQGNQVTVLAANTSKHYYDSDEIPEHLKALIEFKAIKINTDINPFHALSNLMFSRLPYNGERFHSGVFRDALVQLLRDNHFDVIQIEGIYMGLYLDDIKQNSKGIISYRAHNVEHEIWERNAESTFNPLKRWYLNLLSKRIKRLEERLLNKFDVIVPISQRDHDQLRMLGANKPYHVTPAGIDMNDIKLNSEEPEYPSVFYIGALDWIPNQNGLIWFIEQVWSEIKQKYPALQFYIAGRNAPTWFSHKLSKYNVRYLGEVESARDFIKNKAIMVIPLFAGSGMRVKIIEGMAYKKAIITTSIGAEGITIENRKNIIIADNKADYSKSLDELVGNKTLFDEIAENAYHYVNEKFDNFAISKNLLDFYKQHL